MGTWPLHLPFNEDVVNRIMVPGITLPESKTTFLVKLLLLLCFPPPALLWLAEAALQIVRERERVCSHQGLERPLLFRIGK